MSTNIGVVILSRFSSSRLPGKALIEINGKPVLEYIVERVAQVMNKDCIVIATSDDQSDDPIVSFAHRMNIACYRGSLENVATRFYEAANGMGWEYAVRINGDNVFLDTELLGRMVAIASTGTYDFVSNVKNRTYPKGMSIEIVRLSYFHAILPEINAEDRYREHVTLYLYDRVPDQRHLYIMNESLPEAAGMQLALDTPEDLQRTRSIIHAFTKSHINYNITEIIGIIKKNGL